MWHGGKWGEVSPNFLNNSVDEDQIKRRERRKMKKREKERNEKIKEIRKGKFKKKNGANKKKEEFGG